MVTRLPGHESAGALVRLIRQPCLGRRPRESFLTMAPGGGDRSKARCGEHLRARPGRPPTIRPNVPGHAAASRARRSAKLPVDARCSEVAATGRPGRIRVRCRWRWSWSGAVAGRGRTCFAVQYPIPYRRLTGGRHRNWRQTPVVRSPHPTSGRLLNQRSESWQAGVLHRRTGAGLSPASRRESAVCYPATWFVYRPSASQTYFGLTATWPGLVAGVD